MAGRRARLRLAVGTSPLVSPQPKRIVPVPAPRKPLLSHAAAQTAAHPDPDGTTLATVLEYLKATPRAPELGLFMGEMSPSAASRTEAVLHSPPLAQLRPL
eukprot:1325670-Prymnesium_polylepis.2